MVFSPKPRLIPRRDRTLISFQFRSLVEGGSRQAYNIEQFEENHSNIEETLHDLKNIVMKYLPSVCDTVLRNEVLYRLYRLGEDLEKHTIVENNVLIPIVNKIEGR